MPYYSDLSAASSSDDESDDDSLGFPGPLSSVNNRKPPSQPLSSLDTSSNKDTAASCILHLDIDCFYCQCEHIDQNLPVSRPIAIGQKHIIVTSNYAARKLGVKKLQLRDDAYKQCPELLIVEGSDLERYRKHGRKVYEAFRTCLKTAFGENNPAVSRGRGMDEMHADVTCLVDAILEEEEMKRPSSFKSNDAKNNPADKGETPIYIYGDQKETATLTEDQTGAEAIVQPYNFSNDDDDERQSHSPASPHGNTKNNECQERLLIAAQKLGRVIQQFILEQTGFTTTLGFSTNSLLAKVASDLQKPNSINVLYPWRAAQLISSMPLRKIPDAGYKTIKVLQPALERFHGARDAKSFWTCRDLLELPKSEVKQCLENDGQYNLLLQRCKGIDSVSIVDDEGEAQKTISVENSFRRGTVTSPEQVWKGLEDLYVRLPRLLKDRRDWSKHPNRAYPTTLKLTARVVDRNLQMNPNRRRRPFVTRSKQVPFRGQELTEETDPARQSILVQNAVRPLVQALVLNPSITTTSELNVTRLNIAVTKFQDVSEAMDTSVKQQKSAGSTQQFSNSQQLSLHFSQTAPTSRSSITATRHTKPTKSIPASRPSQQKPRPFQAGTAQESAQKKQKTFHSPPRSSHSTSHAASTSGTSTNGIDPATLAELPPEMLKEIVRDYKMVVQSNRHSKPPKKSKPPARIDQFFKPL